MNGWKEEKIKTYEDPEWQVDAFAGEFLCPNVATIGQTIEQIIEKYGVSADADRNQMKKGVK